MFLRRTAILSRGYRSLVLASNRPSVFIGSTALSFPTRNPSPLTGILSRSYAVTNPVMADNASTSGVTADGLKEKLTAQLEAQFVEIEDMSGGCGQAFQAIIVSPQFDKKTMLARHRLVNSVLKDEISAIHAWTPKCYTPEQWQKLQEEGA